MEVLTQNSNRMLHLKLKRQYKTNGKNHHHPKDREQENDNSISFKLFSSLNLMATD